MAQMTDSSPFPAEAGPNGTMNGHPDEDVQMGGDGTAGNNQAAFTANGEISQAPVPASQIDGPTYPTAGSASQPPVNGTTEPAPTLNPSAAPAAYTTTSAPSPYPPPTLPQAQSQQPPASQASQLSAQPSAHPPPTATFATSSPAPSAQMPSSTRSHPDPSTTSSQTTTTTKHEPPSGHAIPTTMPAGSPARIYLNTKVTPVLMEGMKFLAKHEPERPLEWLSKFLGERSRALEGPKGEGVEGKDGGGG